MVSPEEIIELLRVQKNKGEEMLKNNLLPLGDVQYWTLFTKEILIKAFGPSLAYIDSIIYAGDHRAYPAYEPESSLEKKRRKNFRITLDMLEGCMEYLQNQDKESSPLEPVKKEEDLESPEASNIPVESVGEEKKQEPAVVKEENNSEVSKKVMNMEKSNSHRVLIIHGKDEEKKTAVANFLTKLDLEPVIPHEETNQRVNLIEKFEKDSNVDFAIILLTEDEYGYPKGKPEEAKPRPKQNVIFELGFLIGRLPKNLVCALHEEGLDLPSEYQGSVMIPYDAGGLWKLLMARAMKMGNVDIDMNKAI
jgi:predicted nucleotide-binding protein